MRLVGVLAGLGLLLGSLLFGAAPVAAGDPCFHNMNRPPVSEGTATVVKLGDCAFYPTITRVPVGTEIEFLNTDQVGHEVVGANLTWGHHEKILEVGDRIGMTFASAGTYPYTCMIHPGMTGAIVVGDGVLGAGAAAPGDAAPAAAIPRYVLATAPPPAQEPAGASALTAPIDGWGVGAAVVSGFAAVVGLAAVAIALVRRRRRAATGA
jgi:plastocyanin